MKQNRLIQFRKNKNLTLSEFANQIGISASFYYKIEEGYRRPSFQFLEKLKNTYPEIVIDEMFFAK